MTQAALEKGLAITEGELPVFHYAPETGEYLYQTTEYLSVGVGLPANSCTDAPLPAREGYSIYRDTKQGLWVYVENHCGETVFDTRTGQPVIIDRPGAYPPDTTTLAPRTSLDRWNGTAWVIPPDVLAQHLSALKQSKFEEINQWRDEQELAGIIFEWNGHRWDGGQTSHARLSPVLAVAKAGVLPADFFWTDADNQDVAVTAEELIELEVQMLQAMVSQGFRIHERQRAMKKTVSSFATPDEVQAYHIGWDEAEKEHAS
ncbi:TPA: DUF4376 domain-containing protein [Escherichia coli]|nr:DUF4376 domain-containing protein [Escherichia coli]HAZ4245554.1 DUF4376 domain-containing protein [Escherichia coli]HBA6902122.1 DUF4376 domain-containing protein [Escherichia coli]HBA8122546.1 DUF4376 domain-containing protein [Escherichia coli]